MSDINILRESANSVPKESIVSLVNDLLLNRMDMEKVTNFDSAKEYFKEDIVYRFDPLTERHQILQCMYDGVVGTFNRTKWKALSLDLTIDKNIKNSHDQLLNIAFEKYKCTGGLVYNIPLSTKIENESSYSFIVFHSVKGLVARNEYTIDKNSNSLRLTNWNLNDKEELYTLAFVFGKSDDLNVGYNVIDEVTVTTNNTSLNQTLNISNFDPNKDKLMVFKNGLFINNSQYTLTATQITFVAPVTIKAGDKIELLRFTKRESEGYCNIVYGVYKEFNTEATSAIIPVTGYTRGRDKLMLFSSKRGFICQDHYTINLDGTLITFVSADKIVRGETLHFVIFSGDDTTFINDESVESNNLSEYMRSLLIPYTDKVELSVAKPEVTVKIPNGRFYDNNYSVTTQIISSTGDAGTIEVFGQLSTSFKIRTTGIANSVIVKYFVSAGY